ncbi:MAG: amidohydrolase, partial [Clostridia bacterium]|nr:amidohydrolase [Clostridia bacterium]
MKHLIDAHCHIYPDPIARKAVGGISHFYGDLPFDTYDGTLHRLVESGNAYGVEHNIVFSVATTPHQVHSINTYIAQSEAEHPERFTGLGTMHLDSEDMEADFQEVLDLGLHGIKLHPDIQGFAVDEPRAMKIFA